MDKVKKIFVWAAVAFLLFTMFTVDDASTVFGIIGQGIERGVDALSGAVD